MRLEDTYCGYRRIRVIFSRYAWKVRITGKWNDRSGVPWIETWNRLLAPGAFLLKAWRATGVMGSLV